MHISRLAAEILLHIFAAIYDNFGRDRLATLAALARTCKTFKEPALDILWREIIGFTPIISCLPKGVVERTSKGALVSPDVSNLNCSNEPAIIFSHLKNLSVLKTGTRSLNMRIVSAL